MKRKNRGPLIFFLIVFIGLIFLTIELAVLYSMQGGRAPLSFLGQPPGISILHPQGDRVINSGEGIMLVAEAQSDVGLQRVDFLVDGVVEQQHFADPLGATTIDAFFPWFGSTTGVHQLVVIAYDLGGRASEPASVRVGVQAVQGIAQIGGQPEEAGAPIDEQQAPQEQGEAPQGVEVEPPVEEQPQDEADQQAPVQPEGLPEEPVAPAEGQPDDQAGAPGGGLELPPQPQDQPPQITRFDVFVDIFGGENGAPIVASAAAVGSAQDDLGLERLTLTWRNDDQDVGDFSIHCGEGQACEIEMEAGLDVGRWVFILQAFDTSGQASQPEVEIVEVLGEPGQPPAAAEHEVFDDWLREHLRNQAEQFDFNADDLWVGQAGADVEGMLEGMFPGGRAAQPPAEDEEPACAENDRVCQMGAGITLMVEPGPEGNLITLTIDQPLEAPAGKILLPQIVKGFANHNVASSVFPPEWALGRAAAFQPGQQFTWLDEDVVCHEDYRYTGKISAYDPAAIENFLNAGGGLPRSDVLAYESQTATSQVCGAGAVGDLGLTVEVHPEGLQLNWSLPGNVDWPQAGVGVMLVRYNKSAGPDPNVRESVNIYEERFAPADLQQGRDPQFVDRELECSDEYYYLVGVFDPEQRPGFTADGWLAHDSVAAPRHFCPAGQLVDIELEISTGWKDWIHGHYTVATIEFDIPAGFERPPGQEVGLKLWEGYTDENGDYVENERLFFRLGVGRDNLHKIFDTDVNCTRQRYDFYLTLEADGRVLNEGPIFAVDLPPCPPKDPPALQRLHATNNCDGAERCVIVDWAPYQPLDEVPYLPAVAIQIERNTAFLNSPWVVIEVPMNATQFIDPDVRCGFPYLYRMVAVDERGLRRSSSNFSQPPMLRIDTPDCDQPWDLVVEPEME